MNCSSSSNPPSILPPVLDMSQGRNRQLLAHAREQIVATPEAGDGSALRPPPDPPFLTNSGGERGVDLDIWSQIQGIPRPVTHALLGVDDQHHATHEHPAALALGSHIAVAAQAGPRDQGVWQGRPRAIVGPDRHNTIPVSLGLSNMNSGIRANEPNLAQLAVDAARRSTTNVSSPIMASALLILFHRNPSLMWAAYQYHSPASARSDLDFYSAAQTGRTAVLRDAPGNDETGPHSPKRNKSRDEVSDAAVLLPLRSSHSHSLSRDMAHSMPSSIYPRRRESW